MTTHLCGRRSNGWWTLTASMRALMRFSVGAVNIRTGNFAYFDTETHHIGPSPYHGERLASSGFSGDR